MPLWLAEPPFSFYVVLLAVAIIASLAAFLLVPRPATRKGSKEKKRAPRVYLLTIAAIALALMGVLKLCDRMVESDREQISRKLNEMSDGVRKKNLDTVFGHISESFKLGGADKKAFRARGDSAIRGQQVEEIPIWDISIEPIPAGSQSARARFRFKMSGGGWDPTNQFVGKATFVKAPDGEWRLQTFDVFVPPNERDAVAVPGLN